MIKKMLLFTALTLSLHFAKAQVNQADSLALVDLYNATGGPNWKSHTNWLTPSPLSTWYGVTVTNGRVNYLNLPSNQLTGTIPTSLGNLTSLIFLNLFSNQLTGTITSSLGNLAALKGLELSKNQLTGVIPSSLSNLVALTYLDLSSNQLTGNIPTSLENLTALQNLSLYSNQLTGTIPSSLGNLTALQSLWLSSNQLTGNIPTSLGNLTSLTYLNLFSNQLIDTIPTSLGNLTKLTNLNLSSNQLKGAIPTTLGNLTSLTYLYLFNNQLTGTIPTTLGNLTALINLYLYNNQLTGTIPTSLGNLTKLKYLYLNNNQLTGAIPSSLGNLTLLTQLSLSNNQLTGNIPTTLGNLPTLDTLWLQNNQFTFDMSYYPSKVSSFRYSPQANLRLQNLPGNTLSVTAGGTLAQDTFRWYNAANGQLVATKTGDSTFSPAVFGNYYVKVTNSLFTQLTLSSDTAVFVPLPLTLTNFTARASNGLAILSWQTASEQNTSRFVVQHSTNATNFTDLGNLNAIGFGANSYAYTHNAPSPGTNYYRLQSIDKNGDIALSKTISLNFGSDRHFTIAPNPATDRATITIPSPVEKATIEIYAPDGKMLSQRPIAPNAPNYILPTKTLPNGTYYIKLRTPTAEYAEKLLINK